MALKFGPQWLRELSDSGAGNPQPTSPSLGTKFKLADYRYGREEMLSMWNQNSPPPDQVRKHLPIFSKEIQKPITMMPFTEDEQRLVSQGYNSTGVLRAAVRGTVPPLRVNRGGATAERGRGRGRGRGEGYAPRPENGDAGYQRPPPEGWEQVGRKLERSYSRDHEESSSGNSKREYSRSASDNNWRDKKQEQEEEEEEQQQQQQQQQQQREPGWRAPQTRNTRWGPTTRRDWRDPRDLSGFEGEKRAPPQRGFEDSRGSRRISESRENEGEVPEWVEDDVGDDPGTFDSSGAFVSTKDRRRLPGGGGHHPQYGSQDGSGESPGGNKKYVPPGARNGGGGGGGTAGEDANKGNTSGRGENGKVRTNGRDNNNVNGLPSSGEKGDGDCGFAFPHSEDVDGMVAPPGQYSHPTSSHPHHPDHDHPPQQQTAGVASSGSTDNQPNVNKLQQKHTITNFPTPAPTSAVFSLLANTDTTAPQSSLLLQQANVHEDRGAGGEQGVPSYTPAPSTKPSRPQHVDPSFAHVEKSLQNLVAQMSLDTDKDRQPRDVSREALPLTHEHANKWFYKDPQGEIQGPFTYEEMAQWFGAGYFTMSLVVKRGCDDSFKQLGELIKRYGRVPFLPGTPLPPLISTSSPSPNPVQISSGQETPANHVSSSSSLGGAVPQSVPSSMMNPTLPPPLVNPIQDPLLQQMMLLQQEYLKQTFLMRQMQVQTLQQLQQDQENFGTLSPEQQQHLSMQVLMQTNPMLMPQLQHIQQQQLILQQQLQHQQQLASQSVGATPIEEMVSKSFPQAHPTENLPPAASSAPVSSTSLSLANTDRNTTTATNSEDSPAGSVWGNIPGRHHPQQAAQQTTSVWSQRASTQSQPRSQPQPQSQPSSQPASLWDVESGSEQAFKLQMEKLKRAREGERLREEERLRQEQLEKKQEELRQQQEELERQRLQVMKEKEELEKQKQRDLYKREEAKKLEEEARRLEDEKIEREIERQKQEQREAEKNRLEEGKRRQEEEKKRTKELKKQEEKKRKEEEKKKQEEQKKEEMRRKQAEEEERLRHQQLEQERRMQAELQQQEREEEERQQREAEEREREKAEGQKKQLEQQRQNESLRRLHQAQREQLAKMQLPAHSTWAEQQQSQGQAGPTQSRSLTEIQREEARREQEMQYQQQHEMQKMQEQAMIMNQQNQQKSWATHASQGGVSNRGPSLLDIQQQEQENMKKNQKDKPKNTTYQSKLSSLVSAPTSWAGGAPPSGWPTNSTSSVWGDSAASSIWGSQPAAVATPPARRHQQPKESGEFPALKNPSQQNKKAAAKANNGKMAKGAPVTKQKKEEEKVQKLFQNRQQDSFTQWVTDKVSRFSAQIDVPTFVSFIVEVDSPDDVRDYMVSYLGDNKESRDFAKQFVDKRNRSRNQARLEKQQEEDSIWGPAPAVNPHVQARALATTNTSSSGSGDAADGNTGANGGVGGKAGKTKKKKQKMQRLDASSILGFTVHSDPDRKNAAGELESV